MSHRGIEEILDRLRQCSRPVIFETGIEDAPYSTAGTAFLAGFGRSIFVITAAHVAADCSIMVFPSDSVTYPLLFSHSFSVERDHEETDVSDILIERVDNDSIRQARESDGQLINLNNPAATDWLNERYASQFFLCGYPSEHNEVDYFRSEINTQQFFLEGTYSGQSVSYGCHELTINNPLNLTNFSGLSGSPVFSRKFENGVDTPIRFCGMALRGTAQSRRIHFLGADILSSTLNDAQQYLTTL